jgi:hypothetical protein
VHFRAWSNWAREKSTGARMLCLFMVWYCPGWLDGDAFLGLEILNFYFCVTWDVRPRFSLRTKGPLANEKTFIH